MKWILEKRKIDELHEYARNARRISKHDALHLQQSLDKFGQCEPIVINTDNSIIGGHQRLRTMRKMGYKEVDVYVPDSPLEEKEVEELNIRLNRNNGDWDFDMLGNADWGFTMEELDLEEIPGLVDESSEEEKPSPKKCSMTIHFKDPKHLQEAENRISLIVDEFDGAYYKAKL
jgi:hypothetical protein